MAFAHVNPLTALWQRRGLSCLLMPEGFDATALFGEAVERGVAYVPGTHFYPDGGHHNTLRLNFSNSTPQQIHEGMGKLRELFAAHLG